MHTMADNMLEPGQVRTGQLIDGDSATPYQSCSLTYQSGQAPVLQIPFVEAEQQFRQTRGWFRDQKPPASLLFRDNIGPVTLSGLRWRGHSGSSFVLGRISADVTIFEAPRKLKAEYKFKKLASKFDGLDDFARFRSIDSDMQFTDTGHRVVVTVEAKDSATWRQNGFTYAIRANAPWSSLGGSEFAVRSEALIETSRFKRATANEHITAQWPIRALLILANGSKLFWRSHHIVDDDFPTWMMAGSPRAASSRGVLLRRTVRDHDQPLPQRADVALPMFHLSDLGTRGLRRWIDLYQDETFRRAIEPTVEVINGASRFLEPQILMMVLGLDAMGHYRDPLRSSKVPLHRQIERCIAATRVDWSAIGPEKGIAKAIANVNNDLKHPDRIHRPDSLEMDLIAGLALVIMRLQLFDLLGLSENLRKSFLTGNAMHQAVKPFKLNSVTIDVDGHFVSAA